MMMNIYKFNSYPSENTLNLRYKYRLVKDRIVVYCENHTKHLNTLFGEKAEF
jgi:hypothetical protein